MKIFTVKIIKCDLESAWYFELVGEIVECYRGTRDYILKEDYDLGYKSIWRHIAFEDGEII